MIFDSTITNQRYQLDDLTDEELLMMAGDGHFGSYFLPVKKEKVIPKRIEHLDEEIDNYDEKKTREELK